MRIISGTAKGTKLFTLDGELTRPTLDRVKESIFNIIQNEIKESVFLDLFSGSGAIALEAASRGAQKVVACDESKKAINIINKNIQKTHLQEIIDVYNSDYSICLKKLKKIKFDFVYLDPPYKTDYIEKSIRQILEYDLINENSKIIIETDDEKILTEILRLDIEIIDKRKYGRAIIAFLKKK